VDALAADLLRGLLQPEPRRRLCDGDAVLAHPFFAPLDRAKVLAREEVPEYVPHTPRGGELGDGEPEFPSALFPSVLAPALPLPMMPLVSLPDCPDCDRPVTIVARSA